MAQGLWLTLAQGSRPNGRLMAHGLRLTQDMSPPKAGFLLRRLS